MSRGEGKRAGGVSQGTELPRESIIEGWNPTT